MRKPPYGEGPGARDCAEARPVDLATKADHTTNTETLTREQDFRGPMLGEAACHAGLAFRELVQAAPCAEIAGLEIEGALVEALGDAAEALTEAADIYGHHETARR